MNAWAGFFEAAAGAGAALTGLLFVALSVNLAQILKHQHLPIRAGATLGALMLVVVASLAALAPQPRWLFGLELAVFAAPIWWLNLRAGLIGFRAGLAHGRGRLESFNQFWIGQVQLLPFLAAAALLGLGADAGLAWLAGGMLAVFVLSALNAWVLLVEILR
jgi:hypothetical protein